MVQSIFRVWPTLNRHFSVFMVVLDKAWSMCSLPCWSAQLAPVCPGLNDIKTGIEARGSSPLLVSGPPVSPDGLRSQPRSRSSPDPPMAAVAPCSQPQSLPPPMRIRPDWPPGQILSLETPKCIWQTKLRLFIEFCVSASVRRWKALDRLIKVGFGLVLVLPQNGVKITAGTLDT